MSRTKVPKPKYIAEGFHEDAGKLLNEFIEKSTTDFSEFAAFWRKHHFSLVFMGRPDHIESTEFTNEVFKISTEFLSSPSFYKKVGAVYLMYALFRNQISVPPIKIRLEINQWRIIKTLRIEAKFKEYKTLHYVIDYLIKNAFIYVAHQMLRGPLIGMQVVSKHIEAISNLKANYKSDILEYSASNSLQALRDLHIQYLEEKKKLGNDVKVSLNTASDSYEFFIQDLQSIVQPGSSRDKKESLGSRRAKIKALSFTRKTQDRFGNSAEEKPCESSPDANLKKAITTTKKKKGMRNRRVPQHERRVGRPSKKPKPIKEPEPESDDDIDISHLLSQQQEFYLPPVETDYKKIRTRRDPYYKVSPKREEESSKPDNAIVDA